jgi:phosphopantothenoylcysteine decarboxylase/phosphopantothenate--cysteine ligase
MGFALAKAASDMGAEVILLTGPTNQVANIKIKRIDITTAEEMYQAVIKEFDDVDICVMAAAVADYTPKKVAKQKIKKAQVNFEIVLEKTKDILLEIGKKKQKHQTLIGFALETNDELNNAKAKLKRKNLDAIVLNSLNDKSSGFAYDTNKISIIDKNNNIKEFPLKSKTEVAYDIFSYICNDINI